MKKLFVFLALFMAFKTVAQTDYSIRINGTKIPIALDKSYEVTVDGKKIEFTVSANDTLVYDDGFYRFLYLKDFKISRTQIDEGIEQITIMTAEGSGIIIQKYASISPTQLNEYMIKELTKESLNYGYELTRKDYTRKLKSGQSVEVNKAILEYKKDIEVYEVASIGKKDEGILLVTMIMDMDNNEQGKQIIKLLWESLMIK